MSFDDVLGASSFGTPKPMWRGHLDGWWASGREDESGHLVATFTGPNREVGNAMWARETGELQYDMLRNWLGQDQHNAATVDRVACATYTMNSENRYAEWDDLDDDSKTRWRVQATILIDAMRGKCICDVGPNTDGPDEWCPQHGRASVEGACAINPDGMHFPVPAKGGPDGDEFLGYTHCGLCGTRL